MIINSLEVLKHDLDLLKFIHSLEFMGEIFTFELFYKLIYTESKKNQLALVSFLDHISSLRNLSEPYWVKDHDSKERFMSFNHKANWLSVATTYPCYILDQILITLRCGTVGSIMFLFQILPTL